jgi:hypothetical protein
MPIWFDVRPHHHCRHAYAHNTILHILQLGRVSQLALSSHTHITKIPGLPVGHANGFPYQESNLEWYLIFSIFQ